MFCMLLLYTCWTKYLYRAIERYIAVWMTYIFRRSWRPITLDSSEIFVYFISRNDWKLLDVNNVSSNKPWIIQYLIDIYTFSQTETTFSFELKANLKLFYNEKSLQCTHTHIEKLQRLALWPWPCPASNAESAHNETRPTHANPTYMYIALRVINPFLSASFCHPRNLWWAQLYLYARARRRAMHTHRSMRVRCDVMGLKRGGSRGVGYVAIYAGVVCCHQRIDARCIRAWWHFISIYHIP